MGTVMATEQADNYQACHFLACPVEIRNQIYAEILLDFPTPDLKDLLNSAMLDMRGPWSSLYFSQSAYQSLKNKHKIQTNIMLTNRQILAETKEIILRRGRLVKVIISNVDLSRRLCSAKLCLIDAKYSNLTIMTHHLSHYRGVNRRSPHNHEFVLCPRDVHIFCRLIMGDCTFELHYPISWRTRHTLSFTTNFHDANVRPEFLTRHMIHRQALQPFRKHLRGCTEVSIEGSSVGLSRVLAATALRDFKSLAVPDPLEFLDEVRAILPLAMEIMELGNADIYQLLAPFEKAIMRCLRVTRDPAVWSAIQYKAPDRMAFIKAFMAIAYLFIVKRQQCYYEHGPSPINMSLFSGGLFDGEQPLAAALQTYELCVAMPRALGCPKWTPEPPCEVEMNNIVAASLGDFAQSGDDDGVIAFAIGHKAATRAMELAPDNETTQEWMRLYDWWKRDLTQQGIFYEIPDDVMEARGIARWLVGPLGPFIL